MVTTETPVDYAEQLAITAGPLATAAAVLAVLELHALDEIEHDGRWQVFCSVCTTHPCPTRATIVRELEARRP
jgi:hypothetical protein